MKRSESEGSALRAPVENEKFTWEDYQCWPVSERWELIEGIAYDMSTAPHWRHQRISGCIFNKIFNYLENKPCEVFESPTDVKFSEDT